MIEERYFGRNHPYAANCYSNMGRVYLDIKDYATALDHFTRAREIFEEVLGYKHRSTAVAYRNLGDLYKAMHQPEEADKYYQKQQEILKALVGENATVR